MCHACNCSITEFYFLAFAFVSQLQGSFFFMLALHSGFNKTFLAMHIMVLLCESVFHTVPSAVFFQGYLQEEKATEQSICGEGFERACGLVGIEAWRVLEQTSLIHVWRARREKI